MELGVHLPLMEFRDEGLSRDRLEDVVDAAREAGFAAISANDHFVFQTPWLDGPAALGAALPRSGGMDLATTIALVSLRGPVQLAKTLVALDVLSDGRLIAGVGPGSSQADYAALGVPFAERWGRFDEAVVTLRALLRGASPPEHPAYYPAPEAQLAPPPRRPGGVPVWLGSWGSRAGLRRVARLADGWLASAYNTTPERFAADREQLADDLRELGRAAEQLPNALASMWTFVTEDRAEADRVLHELLAPILGRDPDELGGRVCVGPAGHAAELLARYRDAGCRRVYVWPLWDERAQLELIAARIAPHIHGER